MKILGIFRRHQKKAQTSDPIAASPPPTLTPALLYYKCRRCGTVFMGRQTQPFSSPMTAEMNLRLHGSVDNTGYNQLVALHACMPGETGVADLIYFTHEKS
jgi:hypothetical protein